MKLSEKDYLKMSFYRKYDKSIPLYKKASLLVLPSLSESFGNIVVEAMFLNVTVVSTQTAGVNEINGNTDSIYMVSSFQDEGVLSDIMLYAINHPKNPELLQMRELTILMRIS